MSYVKVSRISLILSLWKTDALANSLMALSQQRNSERQAACCADEEDAHHESSSDNATIAAPRGLLCCSSGSPSSRRLEQDVGGWQDDYAEKDVEESRRGRGHDAPGSR